MHIQPTSDFQKVITDIEEINESEETSEQKHNATMNKQMSDISQKTKSNYILEQLLRNCDDKFQLMSEQTIIKTDHNTKTQEMTIDKQNLE